MTLPSGLLLVLLLTLGACALPPAERLAPRATHAEATPPALIGELARVSALSSDQRRRELAELEGARLDEARRFQLAALLERDDSLESLERSLKNLGALGELDTPAQVLVDQMKKSLKARIENKQLAARNAELQGRLEQIKALEKSLQQRSAAPRMP